MSLSQTCAVVVACPGCGSEVGVTSAHQPAAYCRDCRTWIRTARDMFRLVADFQSRYAPEEFDED